MNKPKQDKDMKTNIKRILQFIAIAVGFAILRGISVILRVIGNLLGDIVGSTYRIIVGFAGLVLSCVAFFGFIL